MRAPAGTALERSGRRLHGSMLLSWLALRRFGPMHRRFLSRQNQAAERRSVLSMLERDGIIFVRPDMAPAAEPLERIRASAEPAY